MLAIFFAQISFAQVLSPIHWTYDSKKVSDKTYEVHITAVIDNGWHVYSQMQPKEAIAIPTSIKFAKNPSLSFVGKLKEKGNLERHTETTLGIIQNQYSEKVDFIQLINLIGKAKKVSGTIEFQTCTDEMCLPPKTINFSIKLE